MGTQTVDYEVKQLRPNVLAYSLPLCTSVSFELPDRPGKKLRVAVMGYRRGQVQLMIEAPPGMKFSDLPDEE